MASSSRLVQGIAGGTTKSNIVKVGLGTSINMYPEVQQSEHSCQIMNRTVQGERLAAEITGRCRGMYRVSRGIDNKPTLYAVYDDQLWLINSHNVAWEIGKLDSFGTEVHMVETGGYGSAQGYVEKGKQGYGQQGYGPQPGYDQGYGQQPLRNNRGSRKGRFGIEGSDSCCLLVG